MFILRIKLIALRLYRVNDIVMYATNPDCFGIENIIVRDADIYRNSNNI